MSFFAAMQKEPYMIASVGQPSEEMNWVDYCDSLRSEIVSPQLQRLRNSRKLVKPADLAPANFAPQVAVTKKTLQESP
jgi:hypothetical protein